MKAQNGKSVCPTLTRQRATTCTPQTHGLFLIEFYKNRQKLMTSEITSGLYIHIIYSRQVWNKQFYSTTQISHVDYVYSSGLTFQKQDKPIAYLLESEQE